MKKNLQSKLLTLSLLATLVSQPALLMAVGNEQEKKQENSKKQVSLFENYSKKTVDIGSTLYGLSKVINLIPEAVSVGSVLGGKNKTSWQKYGPSVSTSLIVASPLLVRSGFYAYHNQEVIKNYLMSLKNIDKWTLINLAFKLIKLSHKFVTNNSLASLPKAHLLIEALLIINNKGKFPGKMRRYLLMGSLSLVALKWYLDSGVINEIKQDTSQIKQDTQEIKQNMVTTEIFHEALNSTNNLIKIADTGINDLKKDATEIKANHKEYYKIMCKNFDDIDFQLRKFDLQLKQVATQEQITKLQNDHKDQNNKLEHIIATTNNFSENLKTATHKTITQISKQLETMNKQQLEQFTALINEHKKTQSNQDQEIKMLDQLLDSDEFKRIVDLTVPNQPLKKQQNTIIKLEQDKQ